MLKNLPRHRIMCQGICTTEHILPHTLRLTVFWTTTLHVANHFDPMLTRAVGPSTICGSCSLQMASSQTWLR